MKYANKPLDFSITPCYPRNMDGQELRKRMAHNEVSIKTLAVRLAMYTGHKLGLSTIRAYRNGTRVIHPTVDRAIQNVLP